MHFVIHFGWRNSLFLRRNSGVNYGNSKEMEGKKDHIMPPYRLEGERAKEYYEALEYLRMERTVMARAMVMAVIIVAKEKKRLLFPLQLRTEREFECPHCGKKFWNSEATQGGSNF
jgi:hypothetical protein